MNENGKILDFNYETKFTDEERRHQLKALERKRKRTTEKKIQEKKNSEIERYGQKRGIASLKQRNSEQYFLNRTLFPSDKSFIALN